jgi:hypothetical protein
MGSLSLRPGDSLTIPKMALSIGFMSFVSSAHATQTTGLLTVTPVGLTPTENASLSWTHSHRKTPSDWIEAFLLLCAGSALAKRGGGLTG